MLASAIQPNTSWENHTVRLSAEDKLVQQAQNGDTDAFNQLVLTFQDQVFNLCYHMLGDPAAAEDITQQVFITVYRKFQTFRGGSFRSWLLRIAANACHDELRRLKRRPQISLDDEGEDEDNRSPLEWIASEDPSPEATVEQHQLGEAIRACLSRLPDDYRAVLVLVDIEGLDYREAAEIIRRPCGTVKSRLSRARLQMQKMLSQAL